MSFMPISIAVISSIPSKIFISVPLSIRQAASFYFFSIIAQFNNDPLFVTQSSILGFFLYTFLYFHFPIHILLVLFLLRSHLIPHNKNFYQFVHQNNLHHRMMTHYRWIKNPNITYLQVAVLFLPPLQILLEVNKVFLLCHHI